MIRIDCDLFDIAKRIKEIDENYIIYFNPQKAKFELHRESYGKVGYELTFPFNSLDARAINYCLKTRIERKEDLLKEMEKENKRLERLEIEKSKKEIELSFEDYMQKT